jgi:hypothetical protein
MRPRLILEGQTRSIMDHYILKQSLLHINYIRLFIFAEWFSSEDREPYAALIKVRTRHINRDLGARL